METSPAGPPHPDESLQDSGTTPREQFIRDVALPQWGELNSWKNPKTHLRLLLDAARGRKFTPKKIGYTSTKTFSLDYSGVAASGVYGNVTTLVSHQALRATSNRELTRQCLAMSDVKHLPSKTFHISQGSAAAAYADSLGHPVTVTPASPKLKGHARTNIQLVGGLAEAWEHLAQATEELPVPRQLIEVEAFYPWITLRAFAVGEETVAAVARVPLFVMGDGGKSLGELAEKELQRRVDCSFLEAPSIGNAETLLSNGQLDAAEVIEDGQLQILADSVEGQAGLGWSVDVTDRLCDGLKALTVNALWAFPGLGASAVDIVTPSLDSAEQSLVVGLSPGADLREFRYPAYGKTRLPNRAIMEQLVDQSRARG